MRPGDVIDSKYRIEVQLGEGGMGRVLAASHMTLGSTVAIKLLKTDALKHPEVPARFLREARAAGRLRSEHIVKVTDVGQLASGEPYMVMEMLHGHDLSSQLEKGPVSPELAVDYILQACEGLAEAHALGMVHRDIKPANLFVTRRPNGAPLIKVLDFGIATAASGDVDHRLTTTQTVIGSPSYMSPEQLRATRDVDARSDVWSLGVTMYELLSGKQPFVAPTITALSLKIVGEAHARIERASDELNAIVDRCLAKDREARYANVVELAEALAPLIPHGRVAADMVVGAFQSVPVASVDAVEPSASGAVHSSWPEGTAPPSWQLERVDDALGATALASGEPAAPAARGRRQRTWLAIGAATLGIAVAVGAVLGMTRGEHGPSTVDAAATPARAADEPGSAAAAAPPTMPAPAPPAAVVPPVDAPAAEPPVADPVAVPVIDPAVVPAKAAAATPNRASAKPSRKPSKRTTPAKATAVETSRPTDARTPVEPVEYTKPPVEPTPVPPKKPETCAPSDPQCGL